MKAAFFYLTRSTPKDLSNLAGSLVSLDTNFNDQFHYPVIIFHEDLNDDTIRRITDGTKSKLLFAKIKFELPSFLDPASIPEYVYVGDVKFNLGYRHMCRFFTALVYREPVLAGIDYLCHIDTDAFILDKIDYDMFEQMDRQNKDYGYIRIGVDNPAVTTGLWDATKAYIAENNISPKFLDKFVQNGVWGNNYYYTCFEISRVSFWKTPEVERYFDYLDRLGGIYRHRWGDHVIHLLTVSTFLDENRVLLVNGVALYHQGIVTAEKYYAWPTPTA